MDLSFQLNSVLNNLCDKFGVTLDKLYPILIKQAYVEGICSLICGTIFSIFLILCLVRIYKNYKIIQIEKAKMSDMGTYSDDYRRCSEKIDKKEAMILCFSVISFFLIGIVATQIMDMIRIFGNPEYYVIKNILDRIIH